MSETPEQASRRELELEEYKTRRVFHLEEYKSLRSEILSQGAKYDQMKLIVLGGLGTLYAWMFSNIIIIDGKISCVKFDQITVAIVLTIPVWISLMAFFCYFYT